RRARSPSTPPPDAGVEPEGTPPPEPIEPAAPFVPLALPIDPAAFRFPAEAPAAAREPDDSLALCALFELELERSLSLPLDAARSAPRPASVSPRAGPPTEPAICPARANIMKRRATPTASSCRPSARCATCSCARAT